MSRRYKIIAGIILLSVSALYLLKIYWGTIDDREEASRQIYDYLQAELLDCEYLGREAPAGKQGNLLTANTYFGFYKLTFRVENLSSCYYAGWISNILTIDGTGDDDVRRAIFSPQNKEAGIYQTRDAVIPGKTYVDIVYYVEVREGTDAVFASYEPKWNEIVKLDIALH